MKVYCEQCAALGIEPNPHALQRVSDSTDQLLQSSLDSIVTCEPKRPQFTTRSLMDYIVQLIVCEDEVCLHIVSCYKLVANLFKAFLLIDHDGFHDILKYC